MHFTMPRIRGRKRTIYRARRVKKMCSTSLNASYSNKTAGSLCSKSRHHLPLCHHLAVACGLVEHIVYRSVVFGGREDGIVPTYCDKLDKLRAHFATSDISRSKLLTTGTKLTFRRTCCEKMSCSCSAQSIDSTHWARGRSTGDGPKI